MYEAFIIVVSASIIGIITGVLTSLLVASQFFMEIELPIDFYFPTFMLLLMMGIAGVTTWISVYNPVQLVNKR